MSHIFDWLLSQYDGAETYLIVLESIAVVFGFLSVWYSKQDNLLVFPTGIISTGIFVYILNIFGLLGDMLINAYYFSMSIYGWYMWTRKVDDTHFIPIKRINAKEKKQSVFLFIGAIVFVGLVYTYFEKWNDWTAYVDTFTTALFFIGMWLMAKKKLENWIYWIIADIISIPLYFYKGLGITALQYILFTIVAIYGYKAWKKELNKPKKTLLE
ncbi:MAG: nicotinamide riboside transporter PnuC [Psychroflexus halocasei]|uniref:nicotinamide riboside transporter PnuC n=1 Tax=Psychroflexus sp. S27 TaxID=1982757 RepID=UPI000C2A43E3|nr:nicotinamide riboside transporter PnuC [Psychroflexus sp. S27]PJX20148.1 nicotinamide mononucleotide transporter [Psychroflexus sp. S27]